MRLLPLPVLLLPLQLSLLLHLLLLSQLLLQLRDGLLRDSRLHSGRECSRWHKRRRSRPGGDRGCVRQDLLVVAEVDELRLQQGCGHWRGQLGGWHVAVVTARRQQRRDHEPGPERGRLVDVGRATARGMAASSARRAERVATIVLRHETGRREVELWGWLKL